MNLQMLQEVPESSSPLNSKPPRPGKGCPIQASIQPASHFDRKASKTFTVTVLELVVNYHRCNEAQNEQDEKFVEIHSNHASLLLRVHRWPEVPMDWLHLLR
jgi:hypothetical protein